MKELFLKQGWAGKTISREETVERFNPIIEQHMALNHVYNAVLADLADGPLKSELSGLQKIARADVGKMAEVVYSNGGVAFSGVSMEPEDYAVHGSEDARLFALRDAEQAFQDQVTRELKDVEHHMRSRAILGVVQQNSQVRLTELENATRNRRRPEPSA